MALPETSLAQTGGCRSQQLPRSLPREPRFGWVLRADGRAGAASIPGEDPGVSATALSPVRNEPARCDQRGSEWVARKGGAPLAGSSSAGRGGGPLPPWAPRRPRAHRSREDGTRQHVPATHPERHGVHATITRSLGEALPVPGSSVTSSPSGSAASAGSSAMRRALPPASGSTVPSEVHVVPCRAHAW
jgi:hypothetical protein